MASSDSGLFLHKLKMLDKSVTPVMITVEFLEVSFNTVTKAAMSRGLSQLVLVVYSNILAIFLLVPSSFIFYRNRTRPRLTMSIVCQIFVLSLLSFSAQMCTYIGIGYSSPTMASAMIDLTPGFTFILAAIFRMEKLDLRVPGNQAKVIGTVALITGALILTLYKGPPITIAPSPNKLLLAGVLPSPQADWIFGGILLAAHSASLALYLVVLASIINDYPAEVNVTLINCIFVTIESATISLVAENDLSTWKLRPDMKLIAIGCIAVLVSVRSVVHTWATRKKGPVYVSMFKPLGMVVALVMGVAFLKETLYLGSLVGAAIIALGFYGVIWGKAQEGNMVIDTAICSFKSSSPNVPLLPNLN